jgi:glutamate--cysteine ligase regulatory subunit
MPLLTPRPPDASYLHLSAVHVEIDKCSTEERNVNCWNSVPPSLEVECNCSENEVDTIYFVSTAILSSSLLRLTMRFSNIMTSGSSVIRRPTVAKSNIELINSFRSNFLEAQTAAAETNGFSSTSSVSEGSDQVSLRKSGYEAWTRKEDDTLYIPAWEPTLLAEPRSSYKITVKLFYLPGIPPARRCGHTKQAMSLVLKELGVDSIDLLIVSYPGVSFDADDDGDSEVSSVDEEDGSAASEESAHGMETMVRTWRVLEALHEKGIIDKLGVSEFSSDRLAKFLPQTRIRPSKDQINVKDCCVVPKALIMYAKHENIELLTHNDCTDILPPGTTRELLGPGEKGAGVLAATADADDGGLTGDIEPQWVIKYTAVVEDRGVIENKGYFAMAQVGSCIREQS